MTHEEFLAELKKTPRNWGLNWHLHCVGLRCSGLLQEEPTYECCPIIAVALQRGFPVRNNSQWRRAAEALDLPVAVANNIIRAADGRGMDVIRRDLLSACGL